MKKNDLLKLKNVVAYGDGFKESKGFLKKIKNIINRIKGKKSILVFVEKKVTKNDFVSSTDWIKFKKNLIPSKLDGIETDVIEIGEIEPMHQKKHRPILGGISCIWEKGTRCTLGAIVIKDRKPHILSNEHCIYPWWKGAKKNDKILQPSPVDSGKGIDEIATIQNVSNKLILDGKTQNTKDASIQPINQDVPFQLLRQLTIGQMSSVPVDVKVGDIIQRDGGTNGFRKGEVIATNVVSTVWYDREKNLLGVFKNQIFARNKDYNFVNGGDSGTLVLKGKNPAGLVFAASPEVAVITPIKIVMEELKFTFGKYYVAAGKEWYVDLPLGKTKTIVNLNLRSKPKVQKDTLIKVLPAGTKIEVVNKLGKIDDFEWLEIEIS